MKQSFAGIGIVILFAFMLISPRAVFDGASEGLLLWFQIVIPTLFPFILITNVLLYTNSIHYISKACGKALCHIFKVSESGSFAIVTGFLCGYPMGAKVTADLIKSQYITENEGRYLLSFCNNTSPIFILNFIVLKTLKKEEFLLPSLGILLITPILLSFIFRRFYLHGQKQFPSLGKKAINTSGWDFRLGDTCIMDSFEAITKIGGYIILFSVLLTLVQSIPWEIPGFYLILPFLEVTNGIVLFGESSLPFHIQYPAILMLTSFGGICAIAQTKCMIQKTSLSIGPYVIEKLVTAVATSLIAILYLQVI